jgi:hypothetical protein
MANSNEYRQYAEDCLRLAERAGLPETRSVLMLMAGAWHRVAQQMENAERPANFVGAACVERRDRR